MGSHVVLLYHSAGAERSRVDHGLGMAADLACLHLAHVASPHVAVWTNLLFCGDQDGRF